MSDGMKQRIAAALKETGYMPNTTARNLRIGKTGKILLAVPDIRQNYFAQMAGDVIDQAERHGYDVIIRSCSNSRDAEAASIEIARNHGVDGLILSSTELGYEDARLLEGSFPMVVLGSSIPNAPAPHIQVDNIDGAKAATACLADHGCTKIAMIGPNRIPEPTDMRTSSVWLRFHGYRQQLEELGFPYDSSLVRGSGLMHSANGAQAIADIVTDGGRADGVFVVNDTTAWGVISGLQRMGFRVPQDVKVIGFDNLAESAFFAPPLSSVDPDLSKITHLAVESLIQQINTGQRGEPNEQIVPSRLVLRRSTDD
ncbi:sugar-binding protein [Bifidobacterium eulemuris]|nr:sugar-binding protein [Bifidobacterium eulemuris]